MDVKVYSISNCNHCAVLREILESFEIEFQEIKVLRAGEEHEEGIPYKKYLEMEPSIPLIQRCTFPQVYINGKHTGDIKATLRYLQNETK